jgi:hypothetical protein
MIMFQGKLVPMVVQRVATDFAGGSKFIVQIPGMARNLVFTESQAYGTVAGALTAAGTGSMGLPAPPPKGK